MQNLWTRLTRSLRALYHAFLHTRFYRLVGRGKTPRPTPPTPKPAPAPKVISAWQKRRKALVNKLGRKDHGTRHYGSKRAGSTHARSEIGKGKRSGRQ